MSRARIGFGTPALMGLESRRERFALLEAALDAGVSHFDTSPYYGFGAVEPVLGEFLAAHGSSPTITTKFGIAPPPTVVRNSVVMNIARRVASWSPAIKRILSRGASKMVTNSAFETADAEQSLRTSLRNLRRDRVDFFLLHEPALSDTRRDGLEKYLQSNANAGRIGKFGIGGDWVRIADVISNAPAFASVVQFDNSTSENRVPAAAASGRTTITFGSVGPTLRVVRQRLTTEPGEADRWRRAGAIDPRDEATLAAALLSWAVSKNPDGIVLFATRDQARLRRSMRGVLTREFSPTQFAILESMLKRD